MHEWSKASPLEVENSDILRGFRLGEGDVELVKDLEARSSLRFLELRDGLQVSVGAHIGTVQLGGLRIEIMPKIGIEKLMGMIAYTYDLSDLVTTDVLTDYKSGESGLIDLLGQTLLRALKLLARGGFLSDYEEQNESLGTLRGRLDLQYIATHSRTATLRCRYDDFRVDHSLNQVLAAGVRFAAKMMGSSTLNLELARSADRFLGDIRRVPLDRVSLDAAIAQLDRRSSHYRTALALIRLIFEGISIDEHDQAGGMRLSSFVLNMNTLFERFLERHFREVAPAGVTVHGQDIRGDVFGFVENEAAWRKPTIRPDLVFRSGGKVIAVGDAKYKDRTNQRPTTAELYQLTTYGLAYEMSEPREVMMFYPLGTEDRARSVSLEFSPVAAKARVMIRLVGVPIDGIVGGAVRHWWPFCV